jgi:hypothetical protein
MSLVASKFMIDTGAGVIDADYRGTVFVLLFNLSDQDFEGKFSLSHCGESVTKQKFQCERATALLNWSLRKYPILTYWKLRSVLFQACRRT